MRRAPNLQQVPLLTKRNSKKVRAVTDLEVVLLADVGKCGVCHARVSSDIVAHQCSEPVKKILVKQALV